MSAQQKIASDLDKYGPNKLFKGMNSMKKTCSGIFVAVLLVGMFWSTAQADRSIVLLETNYGDITIELYTDEARATHLTLK